MSPTGSPGVCPHFPPTGLPPALLPQQAFSSELQSHCPAQTPPASREQGPSRSASMEMLSSLKPRRRPAVCQCAFLEKPVPVKAAKEHTSAPALICWGPKPSPESRSFSTEPKSFFSSLALLVPPSWGHQKPEIQVLKWVYSSMN